MERVFSLFSVVLALGVVVLAIYRGTKRSWCGAAFALGMVLLAAETLLGSLISTARLLPDLLAWEQRRLLVMALLPGCWLYFSMTYARGNAKEFVARGKFILLGAFILPLVLVALNWNDLLSGEAGVGPNSMWMLPLSRAGVLLNVLFTAGGIICLMNLESTLRESRGVMRWRIKFMIVGLGLLFAVWCYNSIQAVLYSAVNVELTQLNAVSLATGSVCMSLALGRGGLSGVDLYPPKGLFRGSLTLIVAGLYLLLVGALAQVVAYYEVGRYFPLQTFMVLVAMCMVAIVLLSDRLRQRAKRFLGYYFNRPQYDYRRVWSTFTERTACISNPSEFCREVTRFFSDTFEALSVTIWMVDESGVSFSLGGSTSLSEGESRILIGDGKLGGDVARLLRDHAYPTAVLDIPGELGELLQLLGRKKFENGGDYYFLPLASREEVLGVLIIGDRVSGLPFTSEDFDLMKTIGNQVVATLLSIKLSGRLGEARKLEAFQTMSAFFVHDLKNMASTLSLMLQNLPKHFDDPVFRQDALRAISKSVDKINALIGRLSYFRHKMDIKLVETDLNALVRNTLAGFSACGSGTVTTDLGPLPLIRVDPDQFQRVITNLILNARDASGPSGKTGIRTEARDGGVVLSVSDNGCGMTREFIDQSLFRPFQTTKPDGLGIGLFHSRMIVEAHRGRIEVESRMGEGSTFRIFLPRPGEAT